MSFVNLRFTPPAIHPANPLNSPEADTLRGRPIPGRLVVDVKELVFEDPAALTVVADRIEEAKNKVRESVGKSVTEVAGPIIEYKNTLKHLDRTCECATEKHHRRVSIRDHFDSTRAEVDLLVAEADADVQKTEAALTEALVTEAVFNLVVDVLAAREVKALIQRAVTSPTAFIV